MANETYSDDIVFCEVCKAHYHKSEKTCPGCELKKLQNQDWKDYNNNELWGLDD